MWHGFRVHFQILNSYLQLLIIAAKHSTDDETGFLDQSLTFAFCESQLIILLYLYNCYSQFVFFIKRYKAFSYMKSKYSQKCLKAF